MERPLRLTITSVATLWNLSGIALTFVLIRLAGPLDDALDFPVLRMLPGAAIGMGMAYGMPRTFPFWRALLTDRDRGVLFAGTAIGAMAGAALGVIAAFLVLPADFTAPVQYPPSMAVMYATIAATSFAGTLLLTRETTPFAVTRPDVEAASA